MTSSIRHLKPNQPKWNTDFQQYKDHDPFFEEGLFTIVHLACGRPEFTRRTVLSTLESVSKYNGEVEWIFIENGECEENYQLFNELDLERKVIIRQKNYGINEGLNQGWALSRGQWVMILENDWESRTSCDFLSVAKEIFMDKGDVGLIQLRAIMDSHENWGQNDPRYWPWRMNNLNKCPGIKCWTEKTQSGHEYLLSNLNYGFTNNPIVISKKLYHECGVYPEAKVGADGRHGESEYQERVKRSGCITAHINLDLFYHIGQITTKGI